MSEQNNLDRNNEERNEGRSQDRGEGRRSYGGGGRGGRGGGGGRRGGRRDGGGRGRRKVDYFATNKVEPNYKEIDTLLRFMTDRSKIRPRRQTGLNSKNQRKLAQAIKRARHMALLPYTDEQTRR